MYTPDDVHNQWVLTCQGNPQEGTYDEIEMGWDWWDCDMNRLQREMISARRAYERARDVVVAKAKTTLSRGPRKIFTFRIRLKNDIVHTQREYMRLLRLRYQQQFPCVPRAFSSQHPVAVIAGPLKVNGKNEPAEYRQKNSIRLPNRREAIPITFIQSVDQLVTAVTWRFGNEIIEGIIITN